MRMTGNGIVRMAIIGVAERGAYAMPTVIITTTIITIIIITTIIIKFRGLDGAYSGRPFRRAARYMLR